MTLDYDDDDDDDDDDADSEEPQEKRKKKPHYCYRLRHCLPHQSRSRRKKCNRHHPLLPLLVALQYSFSDHGAHYSLSSLT